MIFSNFIIKFKWEPGESIASGLSMSNAAMFPMAKPYPECTSGSAIERLTMPGSAATFAICFTAGKNPPCPGIFRL